MCHVIVCSLYVVGCVWCICIYVMCIVVDLHAIFGVCVCENVWLYVLCVGVLLGWWFGCAF